MENGIKVQLYLSRCGFGSRRHSELLVRTGDVSINGRIAKIGDRVIPGKDSVKVGKRLAIYKLESMQSRIWLFNKPAGVVCSASDEKGRPTVLGLLPIRGVGRIFTVGRLDFNTEGLLLLTNDGELSYRLLRPESHIRKVYEALVRGDVTPKTIEIFKKGVRTRTERFRSADLELINRARTESGRIKCRVRVGLTEGKYHQVKRMFDTLGLFVIRLRRLSFGPFDTRRLSIGEWQEVSPRAVQALKRELKMI